MSLSALKSEELFKGRVMLEERSERCCEQAWVLRLIRSSADPANYGDYFLNAFLNALLNAFLNPDAVDADRDQNAQMHASSEAHTNTLVAVRLRQAPF